MCWWRLTTRSMHSVCRSCLVIGRQFVKRRNTLSFSRIAWSILYSAVFSTALLPQAPQPGAGRGRGGGQVDPWAGKKRLLIVADPQEWYGVQNYHHQAASHAIATMERIGRESGVYVS